MPQSQEVKEWPDLWAVRGVEAGGSALQPVGGNIWVSPIDLYPFVGHLAIFSWPAVIFYQLPDLYRNRLLPHLFLPLPVKFPVPLELFYLSPLRCRLVLNRRILLLGPSLTIGP